VVVVCFRQEVPCREADPQGDYQGAETTCPREGRSPPAQLYGRQSE